MARMYPAQIYPETKSYGEIEIFSRLKNDPLTHDWIVFHSLDLVSHQSRISGEIDFIIVIPGKGILCIEVKASNLIRRDNGIWYYGIDNIPDTRGPFKQASEAMHSLRKQLSQNFPELSSIVFWSGVIFPFAKFSEHSLEWHDWQVIDCTQFSRFSIGQSLLRMIENARSFLVSKRSATWFHDTEAIPTNDQCRKIITALRQDFEVFEAPASRIHRRQTELKNYTQEQFDALDAMQENPRVIFSGPAGTGKTLLAIEAARRASAKRKKTLLLCFNHLLRDYLQEETASLKQYVVTNTLHGFMLELAKIDVPENPDSTFWQKLLPDKALESMFKIDSSKYLFDQIIIDEAQDILRDVNLDFLDCCLSGGLFSGHWMMFGDFEKQLIYQNEQNVRDILDNKFSNVPKYGLRVNCRNTPRIAELAHILGGLNPGYSRVRRSDNSINPKIIQYTSSENQVKNITKILNDLHSSGYNADEIVILSTRADLESVLLQSQEALPYKLIPVKRYASSDCVRCGTIHSFKGLESPVVILTDLEQIGRFSSLSLFYVGITRALDRLYLLVNSSAMNDLNQILDKPK